MKTAFHTITWRIAVSCTLLVLASAVVYLAVNFALETNKAPELAERLKQIEDAARRDPAAADELQAEVERQTGRSLERKRFQRYAALAALVSATFSLVLIKSRKTTGPPLPRCVEEAVARHVADIPNYQSSSQKSCMTAMRPVDLRPLEGNVTRIGREQRHLIPLLHAIDREYHFLPQQALQRLVELTNITHDQIAGVASFYPQFRSLPRGEHLIRVCRGTACHVAGADRIYEELRRELGISPGDDTTPDGKATVEAIGCLGCCTLAPVVHIDDRIEGQLSVDSLPSLLRWDDANGSPTSFDKEGFPTNGTENERLVRRSGEPPSEIRVGVGSCCVAGGSGKVLERFQREIDSQQLNLTLKPVGCVGICHLTPLVEVIVPGREPIVATRVSPAHVRHILQTVPQLSSWPQRWRNRVADFWHSNEDLENETVTPCKICPVGETAIRRFTDPQVRIVTEHSGLLSPTSLTQYRAHDGFVALERCLNEHQPKSIINSVEKSGLRGRGGGGYPTAVKWRKISEASGEKFLVCNGDEGDPGAFMDRMIMESYPYRVLEGMAIAAYAVGARKGFLYVRHEYPLAVERLRHAIDEMTRAGLLGASVCGTHFSFEVELVEGAGAFVCGEETALLQSIMGRRGIPQLRPPYPVDRGLFDRPTLINNVETFANVPWIIRNGPERFAAIGTETSKGTKVFSLAGKVRRGGLIEIPFGLTIREVVENIGGGVAQGRRFKAVQIGGPSGGCIPAELADTPMDYENLRNIGTLLGSGGLVVMDDEDCVVDMARYFLEFTQRESCGHCTFCRVGTRKLLDILDRICSGKGKARDLDEMESLSHSICLGSLCGLGKTAPNPVLSTLKYFRSEYEAHLEGRCPSGRCKSLVRYEVTRDCIGCTLCAQRCPVGAIPPTPYRQHVIDSAICTRCDACRTNCPEHAIEVH